MKRMTSASLSLLALLGMFVALGYSLPAAAENPICKPGLLCSVFSRFCDFDHNGCPNHIEAGTTYYQISIFNVENSNTTVLTPSYATEQAAVAATNKLEQAKFCIQLPPE